MILNDGCCPIHNAVSEEEVRLLKETHPEAPVLSEEFHVSRQIIVQDIAILKGAGYEILSTHNGYVLQTSPLKERVFKVWHTTENTEDERNCIVNLGGMVVDVFVCTKYTEKSPLRCILFPNFR